jgi:hypothetical protein
MSSSVTHDRIKAVLVWKVCLEESMPHGLGDLRIEVSSSRSVVFVVIMAGDIVAAMVNLLKERTKKMPKRLLLAYLPHES